MEINERFVKIGKVSVSFSMELGGTTQIKFAGEELFRHFECVKSEKKDNQDGTFDEIYHLKENV